MKEVSQKIITKVKATTLIKEKIAQLLILLTGVVVLGSFFLSAIIISSIRLTKL